MNWKRLVFALALVPGVVSAEPAPTNLKLYLWKNRIVLVAGPHGDAQVVAQRQIFQAHKAGFRERDLLYCEKPGNHFAVLLIGKDGEVKVRSDKPLSADSLFGTIDAMPMRKEEMRKR